jgi:hypothetical protein
VDGHRIAGEDLEDLELPGGLVKGQQGQGEDGEQQGDVDPAGQWAGAETGGERKYRAIHDAFASLTVMVPPGWTG